MVPLFSILAALGLPLFALARTGKGSAPRHGYLLSVVSFAFCAAGMLLQLYTVKRRLLAGDLSGIEDTIDAVLLISVGTLVGTVVLNLIWLGMSCGGKETR